MGGSVRQTGIESNEVQLNSCHSIFFKFIMLDARQLEALSAVVEHGGFGAAAQALSIISLNLEGHSHWEHDVKPL